MDSIVAEEITERVIARGGFVNAHSHLDIAWVAELSVVADLARQKGLRSPYEVAQLPLREKIDLLDLQLRGDPEVKASLASRMERTLDALADTHGRACRSCITVGVELDPTALDVAGEVKAAYAGNIDFHITALHMRNIQDDHEERESFMRACEHPAVDVVGGLPQVGCSDLEGYFDLLFEISKRVDKPLEVHTDELLAPHERETGIFAIAAERQRRNGYAHLLSVVHAAALSNQPPEERARVAESLARAEVGVIICPRSSIGIASLDRPGHLHNCIAPLRELLHAGVLVAIGTDNINDVFVPFSRGDLLEELDFLAEATRCYDLDLLADIASCNGARILGLER